VHGDRREVVEALAGLPPRQREALVLRYWLDLPLAAIADAMGVRIGTVKSQISRGLAVVGAALREDVER
jgi:RNA polymerase sigma factor (sigma-70 family)